MTFSLNTREQPLRLAYYNAHNRELDAYRLILESYLAKLGPFTIKKLKHLQELSAEPCDLLVVAAHRLPEGQFLAWLLGFSDKIIAQGCIWVPALIIADANFETLSEVLEKAVHMNWYFDIMSEAHLASLPIRVANLLRIHDHLHELKRYEKTLETLSQQLAHVTSQLLSPKLAEPPKERC